MTEKKRGRRGTLCLVIDPFLFEGGRTISGIADEVLVKLGTETKYNKAAIVNNIRSRIVVYSKQGYTVEKTADRIVKLVPAAAKVA